jgi:hypothetical protein
MAEEDPASPSASPMVEESVEVEPDIKEEQETAEDGSDEAAQSAAKSGEPVTNQQYKALKEITERLINHKVTRRGDECAGFQSAHSHHSLTVH